MKRLHDDRVRFVWIGILTIMVTGSARVCAEFLFGEPNKVSTLNTASFEGLGNLSSDGLTLYLASSDPRGGNGCSDIYIATRLTLDDNWRTPLKLDAPVNTDASEDSPCLSADGLELYFCDGWNLLLAGNGCLHRPGGYGEGDIWVSTRATKEDPWGEPVNLGSNVNGPDWDSGPSISSDGLSLYFHSYGRADSYGLSDIYVTQRDTKEDPWGPAENLGSIINNNRHNMYPTISPDGLCLYFSKGEFYNSYAKSRDKVYVSTRPSVDSPWEEPVPFTPVNSSLSQYSVKYVTGCSTLYFARCDNWNPWDTDSYPITAGTTDIWQVEVTPMLDFNSDGIIDAGDIAIMVDIDNWHTENKLCDIAPAPLGDGFVDMQDLTVLAEHLFEAFTLVEANR